MRSLAWKPIVLVLLLALGACAGGLTGGQSMAVACRGYAATLGALAPFKPAMTGEQVASINAGVLVISPLCRAAARGEIENYAKALTALRNELRIMLVLEQEIKG